MRGQHRRNIQPLSKEREDALNAINFNWVGVGQGNDETWEENFKLLVEHIDSKGNLNLPTMINGKHNLLYRWWFNQRISFEKGNMPEHKIQRFIKVGIDLNETQNNSKRDGFTRWANRLREISDFINTTGNFPKAGKDKAESNLYQSLARTKRAYKNGELSYRQIELINELKIDLE